MKIITIKCESKFQQLRSEELLRDSAIDYEVLDVKHSAKLDESPEIERLQEDPNMDNQPHEEKVSTLDILEDARASNSAKEFRDLANIDDEPENLGQDFLKAQLSTKNQMKIRNILALISSLAVVIAFILEKLGIL